jgi:thioesterase domain-containing protein
MIQTTHPAADAFPQEMSRFRAWWYSVKKRIRLERENLSYRGFRYFQDRMTRTIQIITARTALAIDDLLGRDHDHHRARSIAYVLEVLGIEHDKAYSRYQPKPYAGEVTLFRTAEQLPGFQEDRSLGWERLLGAALTVCDVPGHQQNVLVEPHVSALAKLLTFRLNAAQGRYMRKTSKHRAG